MCTDLSGCFTFMLTFLYLRIVSFRYPEAGKDALCDVSFHIKPSSLAVIVGDNGSGKSTLVNLLTGFHSATSGEILVDGAKIDAYRSTDLRQATALLTQDFTILPLTISDNIALGDPDEITDDYRVHEAARLGGADQFVKRLPKAWSTVLHPLPSVMSYAGDIEGPLLKYMQELDEHTDVSGE